MFHSFSHLSDGIFGPLLYLLIKVHYIVEKKHFLYMHAKPSFAHCLQTAKIAYSDTCAQNNGPSAQNNGPSAQNNDSSTQNNGPSAQKNGPIAQSILLERNSELVL